MMLPRHEKMNSAWFEGPHDSGGGGRLQSLPPESIYDRTPAHQSSLHSVHSKLWCTQVGSC